MDLILHNGNLHTMDKDKPTAQAIAMECGIITAVGSDAEILALKTDKTELVDLGGKTVIPGLNDSHLHLLFYAIELGRVGLHGVKSIDEMIERFRDFIIKNNVPEGTPVLGWGWNQNFFEGSNENPSRYDLDKASSVHPIYAARACGHIGCANSAMINHFSIDKNTPEVPGGEIVRDEYGEPTGIFSENARQIFRSSQIFNKDEIKAHILRALPHYAKLGITSVHSDDFGDATPYEAVYEAYIELVKEKKLTVRVNEKCRVLGLENYRKMLNALPHVDDEIAPYFKLGPVKIMADGSLGGRTAYMKEDYHDDPGNRGIPIYSREEFDAIVELVHSLGRQVAVHAIGDETMQWCMDAIKKVRAENPKDDIRHAIVHCQITDEALLKEFKEHDVTAYIQPIFIHSDWSTVASRVGEAKAATSYAFKTLKDMGVAIPFGTDSPVEPLDPFANIYCAVSRKDLSGKPETGFNPNEALSVEEAVYAYTADGAYTSYEEDKKGKLKVGMFADAVVLTKDIFTIAQQDIPKTEVEMTIFDGKLIYRLES